VLLTVAAPISDPYWVSQFRSLRYARTNYLTVCSNRLKAAEKTCPQVKVQTRKSRPRYNRRRHPQAVFSRLACDSGRTRLPASLELAGWARSIALAIPDWAAR